MCSFVTHALPLGSLWSVCVCVCVYFLSCLLRSKRKEGMPGWDYWSERHIIACKMRWKYLKSCYMVFWGGVLVCGSRQASGINHLGRGERLPAPGVASLSASVKPAGAQWRLVSGNRAPRTPVCVWLETGVCVCVCVCVCVGGEGRVGTWSKIHWKKILILKFCHFINWSQAPRSLTCPGSLIDCGAVFFRWYNMASSVSVVLYGASLEWGEALTSPPSVLHPRKQTILPLEPAAAGVMDGRGPT